MDKQLSILHHLGLGDLIDCNGIVRHYAQLYDKIFVYSKPAYFNLTKYMYRDSNIIEVVSPHANAGWGYIPNVLNSSGDKLIIGYGLMGKYDDGKKMCSQIFYEIANLPYEKKYSNFYFQRDLQEEEKIFNILNSKNEKYIFIFDDETRGFKIDIKTDLKIIKNNSNINPFNMIKLFENAEEIHCMSSSILCLLDCLCDKIKFKKLYLHKKIRNVVTNENSLHKQWIII